MNKDYTKGVVTASMIDPVIKKYSDSIKDWGYVAEPLKGIEKGGSNSKLADLSRLTVEGSKFYAVNPTEFFD